MIKLTSILSGFQAILGTSGTHFALLLCLVIFARPPQELEIGDTEMADEIVKHAR